MENDILQLDEKFADDFWVLRKELFEELGEISQNVDTIIEYSRKNKIGRLWLNYSEAGEGLYVKKGFIKKNNEVEIFI